MDWINNENCRSSKSASVAGVFKVKKCLFDKDTNNKTSETNSPVASPSCLMDTGSREESPYALFRVKKKKAFSGNAYSSAQSIVTTPIRKNCSEDVEMEEQEEVVGASFSQSASTVHLAVQEAILNPDLIGDFSKPCALPTIKGRHPDLKTVTPETVADLLQRNASLKFTLIDCRYPYEYEGGHIKNAQNVYVKEDVESLLLNDSVKLNKNEARGVFIFYCEFSSERGPSMLRHLRSKDRELNKDCYPFLYYPELYILEGGYKAFYSSFKEFCDPQEYKMMLDKSCAEFLAYYRAKSKSWNRQSKRLKRTRPSLVF